MAQFEIIYREGYCVFRHPNYCSCCHTAHAIENQDCECFSVGKKEKYVIPFGDCVNAKYRYAYKGMSIKNYELTEEVDEYDLIDCMILETKNERYYCEKVIMNGKVIYGENFEPEHKKY